MIISDTHRFVFVHIPKCAGMSVRSALSEFDDTGGRFEPPIVVDLPGFGPLDQTHAPLHVLRDRFPEDFAKLRAYRSVAVCRDPFARFPSALAQRFKMYRGLGIDEASTEMLEREIETVLARLRRPEPVTEPEFIHFARQSDFVQLGGERVVKELWPIEAVDRLVAELRAAAGAPPLPPRRENRQLAHRAEGLRAPLRLVRRLAERVLPPETARRARRAADALFKKPFEADAHPILACPDIHRFVAEYYAEDVALYAESRRLRLN